jgi:hypothetical protein
MNFLLLALEIFSLWPELLSCQRGPNCGFVPLVESKTSVSGEPLCAPSGLGDFQPGERRAQATSNPFR